MIDWIGLLAKEHGLSCFYWLSFTESFLFIHVFSLSWKSYRASRSYWSFIPIYPLALANVQIVSILESYRWCVLKVKISGCGDRAEEWEEVRNLVCYYNFMSTFFSVFTLFRQSSVPLYCMTLCLILTRRLRSLLRA